MKGSLTMSDKNLNNTDKAIITLGKIFKIFVAVVVVMIIALCIYLATNSKTVQAQSQPLVNISKSICGSFVV